MVSNEQVLAAVSELNGKVDRLLQIADKTGDWLTLNAARREFRVSYDDLKAAIAAGSLPARPHTARGGFKSFLVKREDVRRLFDTRVVNA